MLRKGEASPNACNSMKYIKLENMTIVIARNESKRIISYMHSYKIWPIICKACTCLESLRTRRTRVRRRIRRTLSPYWLCGRLVLVDAILASVVAELLIKVESVEEIIFVVIVDVVDVAVLSVNLLLAKLKVFKLFEKLRLLIRMVNQKGTIAIMSTILAKP